MAHRRSLLLVEEALVGPRLLNDLASANSQSDANLLRTVVNAIEPDKLPDVLEALSLEVGVGREVTWRRSVCITDLIDACIEDCREEAEQVVGEILDEVVDQVVERQGELSAVPSYTHFYPPLANTEDITLPRDVPHSCVHCALSLGCHVHANEEAKLLLVKVFGFSVSFFSF